ncbi:MAG: hypothetical protein ABWX74_08030 [Aeromicrobium sp.]
MGTREGAEPSVAAGPVDAELLTTTIGDDFAATVRRFGDREALVDALSGRRWTTPVTWV